ncbi:DUF1918 domain-containing protein, partial [Glutamicibacter sp. V16R2B1]|uniref:DUF1918 domain-containing protein n=1 Tax=Glutamicibacter sp. V16R2B1 TaxID=2036207 RepID=UPI0010FD12E1
MTETSTETRYSLGDRVTVASHFVWCGHDTHGRTGKVVEVHSFADTTFYEVGFGDGRAPAPYLAHELCLVRRGGLAAVRHP